jgi:hypothetical protein
MPQGHAPSPLPEIARDVYLPVTALDAKGELLAVGTAMLDEEGVGRFRIEIPPVDQFEAHKAHRVHFHSGTVLATRWYRCEPGEGDHFHFWTEEIEKPHW